MLKLVFILVINSYQGGINTDLHFDTLAKCEAAKKQIFQETYQQMPRGSNFGATCLEMRVTPKKLNCKILNQVEYRNRWGQVMYGEPYPVGVECVEE